MDRVHESPISTTPKNTVILVNNKINIGTHSVQELFFCDRGIPRTVYSNDLFNFFFGCDVQHERNWEFTVHMMLYR